MNRRIIVQELVISAHIGHLPAEREVAQPVALDIRLDIDWKSAAQSKALDDTVCYATLCSEIRTLIESKSWTLLEELSEAVHEQILKCFPRVTGINLRIKKFAVPGTDWVAVESEYRRNATA